MAVAKRLRSEFVVGVTGVVQRRSADTVNPKLATGEVEILAREIHLLNEARTPPFQIAEDGPVSEDVRMRYRYLDLRRPRLQQNIGLRHRVSMAIRKYFDAHGFWEIETPILAKSTPEGARDFLVPSACTRASSMPSAVAADLQADPDDRRDRPLLSDRPLLPRRGPARRSPARVHAGGRRSLVRTPGNDLRPDRAADADRLQGDRPRGDAADPADGVTEAIARYGSDKPDCAGMEIHDLSAGFRDSEFRVFKQIVADGGVVRGFAVRGGNKYSRSQLDVIVDQAKQMGFTGLIWVRPGEPPLSSVKALSEATLRPALEQAGAASDDLLLMAAGKADETSKLLGQLRLAIAKKENLLNPDVYQFLWVTDFPLLEYAAEDGRWYSMHHPFTAPHARTSTSSSATPARACKGLRPRAERVGDRRR
jgi:aspartyl-tRNA synthetase